MRFNLGALAQSTHRYVKEDGKIKMDNLCIPHSGSGFEEGKRTNTKYLKRYININHIKIDSHTCNANYMTQ